MTNKTGDYVMKTSKPWAIHWPSSVKSPKLRGLRFSTRDQAEGAAQAAVCQVTADRTMQTEVVFGVVYNATKKEQNNV